MYGEAARDALSNYLQSRTWDVMFTATFASRVRYPRQAVEKTQRIIPVCRKTFVVAEPHRLGGYHTHGLVEFNAIGDFDRVAGNLLDNLRRVGYSRVETVRSVGAVSAYCTKYLTKTLGDWDFTGGRLAWNFNVDRSSPLNVKFYPVGVLTNGQKAL